MGKDCCEVPTKGHDKTEDGAFTKVLWAALVLNLAMFFFEFFASFGADSVSLLADAVDFLGDAGNYMMSLVVLPMAYHWRSRAALIKGSTMLLYGLFVGARTIWLFYNGELPHAATMGLVGFLALAVNLSVAFMLFRFRDGDANRKSVWICSRNDAIGNLAVLVAAGLVAYTSTAWPDLIVAVGMAALSFQGGILVVKESIKEMVTPKKATLGN